MKTGFEVEVKADVEEILRDTPLDATPSILGFLRDLKKKKKVPNTAAILWESRIHLVKMVASGSVAWKTKVALEPLHLLALYLYTGNPTIHEQVNKALTKWSASSFWHPMVFALHQAVSLLPRFQGEAYRSIDSSFDAKSFALGTKLKWSTFTISSSEWQNATDLIGSKRGMVFIIQSRSGRLIKHYSQTPLDSEVIYLPGTEFEIINYYRGSLIALGQANIREKCYGAKPKDLDLAAEGKGCLLIEIRELDPCLED